MEKEALMIHIHDAATGKDMQREMTDKEIAAHEALIADSTALPSAE